jgi:hypothetical protein
MSDKQRYLSPDDFLRGTLAEPVDLDVPPLGTVRVRGLTVGEVSTIRRSARADGAQLLMQTIALGMVEPQMTAEQLLAAPAGMATVFERIGVRIAELSGLSDDQEEINAFLGGGSSVGRTTEPPT